MILTSLDLKAWKTFPELHLEFEAGTTFLVARNGIGKTSVIQAICFALFGRNQLVGSRSPVASAIRGSSESAVVRCSMLLDGVSVDIERTISRPGRGGPSKPLYWIDGAPAVEDSFSEILRRNVGLDQTELELLSVMSETAPSRSDDVGSEIAQSLSSTFGVNRLRDQATHFGARAKELDRDADERRKELRDTPLKEGVTQRTEIEANLVATRMEIEEINGRLAESQRIAKVTKEWQDHDEAVKAHEVWLRIDAERLRSLHELIDNSGLTEVSSISVLERQDLPELIRLLRALSESETRDVGRCEALLSLTAQLMAQINSEDGVCPVCRRPLLAHDAERALLEHEETRERLTAELADARTKLETLGDLLERAELAERNDSPRMPAAPEHPRPDSAADVAERNVETQALFVTADARRADFEAQLRSIDAQESTLRSNEVLSRGLFDTYRIAERSYVAADVLDSLADLVVARRIEPLANEMQKRWSHIWSGEPLIMNEQGTLSLEIDGASVPYSEFSGGQRTVANVILRLLTLELTAVKAFAVLDEPLEHLDPKNRRLLASLLVRASQPPSRIEQLLVTTYEESVTRRLSPWQGSNTSTGARITYLESAS